MQFSIEKMIKKIKTKTGFQNQKPVFGFQTENRFSGFRLTSLPCTRLNVDSPKSVEGTTEYIFRILQEIFTCSFASHVHFHHMFICITCSFASHVHLHHMFICIKHLPASHVHIHHTFICITCSFA